MLFSENIKAIRLATALLLALCAALPARAQDDDNRKAPFVTTPANVVDRMLALAGTGPTDYVIDLGSGDGRIVIAAAAKFGAHAAGIELDPRLVEMSRENARAAGVATRAEFRVGDVFASDYSSASVVTAYLLPWMLVRLEPVFVNDLKPDTRIVTHAFKFPGWRPDRSETVRVAEPDPKAGVETSIFLWVVPAKARGVWQAASPAGDWRLRISQNYQEIDVEGEAGGARLAIAAATLNGSRIAFSGAHADGARFEFSGRVEGNRITGEARNGTGSLPLSFGR